MNQEFEIQKMLDDARPTAIWFCEVSEKFHQKQDDGEWLEITKEEARRLGHHRAFPPKSFARPPGWVNWTATPDGKGGHTITESRP